MELKQKYSCQVLVIGSGIAGISAALSAAEAGASVILACKGKLFSGSSFYPGTWGLGLIGPENEQDEQDLAESIRRVGCDMADPELVKTFVSGIQPAISRVRRMGVKLRRAANSGQKEFIPCFDHKHRDWNGIEFASARQVFSRQLEEKKVKILSGCDVLELVREQGRVCGAVMAQQNDIFFIGCGAVVLATGGYGTLFRFHLCTEDVTGMGQYLALQAGCSLVNMEFMQMMPGYVSPSYKTVFNEKTFRFARFNRPSGSLPADDPELLELRSTHGPFTSRLASREVDFGLFDAFCRDETGVLTGYSDEMYWDPPEFVKVYFDWLLKEKGIAPTDPIRIGIFAHAANGGIRIRPDASTGVPGLYAAGEVTGGMHGADRIGGLSTANGLVFGSVAGVSAASFALEQIRIPQTCEFAALAAPGCREALAQLQQVMFRNAMILRSESGLTAALDTVSALRGQIAGAMAPSRETEEIVRTRLFLARCATAECILRAALLRRESRGSHYRTDYPEPASDLQKPIFVRSESGHISAAYQSYRQ